MSFVYRYVDLGKEEVVYIGKVNGDSLQDLYRRHQQHRSDSWYNDRVVLQYQPAETPADADMLETYLISQYAHTGQLFNIAKTSWGRSRLCPKASVWGNWKDFFRAYAYHEDGLEERVTEVVRNFFKSTEGLDYHVEEMLDVLCDQIRGICKDMKLARELYREYGECEDFMRRTKDGETK